jgi:hypothetical protein
MKQKSKSFTVIAIVFVVIILSNQTLLGQSVNQNPLDILVNINVEEIKVERVLESLSTVANVPIGFEFIVSKENKNDHLITLNASQEKLSTILNMIIEQISNYKWSFSDGIINICPKVFSNKILDFQIKEAKLDNILYAKLGQTILTLPDIAKQSMKAGYVNDLTYFDEKEITSLITKYSWQNPKISLSRTFSSVTLRDLLNEMLKSGDAIYWVVRVENGEKKQVSLLVKN